MQQSNSLLPLAHKVIFREYNCQRKLYILQTTLNGESRLEKKEQTKSVPFLLNNYILMHLPTVLSVASNSCAWNMTVKHILHHTPLVVDVFECTQQCPRNSGKNYNTYVNRTCRNSVVNKRKTFSISLHFTAALLFVWARTIEIICMGCTNGCSYFKCPSSTLSESQAPMRRETILRVANFTWVTLAILGRNFIVLFLTYFEKFTRALDWIEKNSPAPWKFLKCEQVQSYEMRRED